MGSETYLYGFIKEMHYRNERVGKLVRRHNTSVIESLPRGDDWPPITREMFHITNNDKSFPGPNLEYRGRLIHFGASLKELETEWREWKTKFDALLARLHFFEATVHIRTETGEFAASWWLDIGKFNYEWDDTLPPLSTVENRVCNAAELDKRFPS